MYSGEGPILRDQVEFDDTPEQGDGPVLELSYQGDLVGWLNCACVFEPACDEQMWVNSAILQRFGA